MTQMMSDKPAGVMKLFGLLGRIAHKEGQRSRRTDRLLLLISIFVFAIVTALALQHMPGEPGSIRWLWAAAAMGLALVSLLNNAVEFWLSGRLLGRDIPLIDAIRVSVLGSAANVLPIPGAVLIRTRALRMAGERTGKALVVTTAFGVAWIGYAAALAGVVLLISRSSPVLTTAFIAAGVASNLLVIAALSVTVGAVAWPAMAQISLVEVVSVLLSGTRLYTIARSVDFDIGFVEAVTINLGGILSSAAGFLPGGFGLREVISGSFATLVGAAASIGVLLAVGDRVVFYLTLAVVVLVLLVVDRAMTPKTVLL